MGKGTMRIAIPDRISDLVVGILRHEEWDAESDSTVAWGLADRIERECKVDFTAQEIDVLVLAIRGRVETDSFEADGLAVASSMGSLLRRLYAANKSFTAVRQRKVEALLAIHSTLKNPR